MIIHAVPITNTVNDPRSAQRPVDFMRLPDLVLNPGTKQRQLL